MFFNTKSQQLKRLQTKLVQNNRKRLRKNVKLPNDNDQESSEAAFDNSLSRSQININSESIPTINDSLTVTNITKAKNFLFRLWVAQNLDRYKLFGENARKSIDIIFAAREDNLDHTSLDRDQFLRFY